MHILIISAFFAVIELVINIRPNVFSTKAEYFLNNVNRIEVLILGSSHNQNAIITRKLSLPAANIAYGAQELEIDFKLLDRYIDELENLKYVIIEVAYHSLEYSRGGDRAIAY